MRAIFYAILINAFFLAALECGYRYTGGVPSVMPGKTNLEFQWKVKRARTERVIYVIGDSRVDWGFADRLFTREFSKLSGRKIQAINAGMASGSVEKIITYILAYHTQEKPGVMVINFTPASFCLFKNSPGEQVSNLTMQDFLDHRITHNLVEILYTYGRDIKSLFKHFYHYMHHGYTKRIAWFSRTVFYDGFINAEQGWNSGSKMVVDISPYQKMFQQLRNNLPHYKKRMDKTYNAIRKAKRLGWKVILIRIPIGDRLMELEADLPESLRPKRVASQLSLPFIDYSSDPRTSDIPREESHLKPAGARKLSMILAHDMSRLLMSNETGGKKP
jgi:hypothetical protein